MDNKSNKDALSLIKKNQAETGYEGSIQEYEQLYSLFVNHGYKQAQIAFARLSDISNYLPLLKSGPLSLYILYVLKANNDRGSSFWSIDALAKKLQTTTKSITNWNTKLIDLGLIHRLKGLGKSTTTVLLPTSPIIINEKTQESIKLLEKINYKLQGYVIFKKDNKYITYRFFESNIKYKINNPIIILSVEEDMISDISDSQTAYTDIDAVDGSKIDEITQLLLETEISGSESTKTKEKIKLLVDLYQTYLRK